MTKILVVDKDKDVCDFIVRFFKERNFEVFNVTNGNDALRVIKKGRPHIVLTELEMKDIGGIEILEHIKNTRQDIKVIIVSSVNDIKIMNEAKGLGAVAYLTKPISLSELMDVISQNLGRRRRFFELNRVSKNV